ncbi:MAG TPA: twin-arginine translocase subunit TatC [Bryobacteraceae bacterium]|nr:twin-arginine translocase subunit TatC [Bryobacteraceae bacterium]
MAYPEDQKGAQAPEGSASPSKEQPVADPAAGTAPEEQTEYTDDYYDGSRQEDAGNPAVEESPAQPTNGSYTDDYYDGYPTEESSGSPVASAVVDAPLPAPPPPATAAGGSGTPPPPSPPDSSDGDSDDEGMLRMSFLEHLEELRARLIKTLFGIGVAFAVSLTFTSELWRIVSAPAVDALRSLGYANPGLTQITPMEVFNVIWIKLPILCAIFLASPWVLYQVWAFISPGLYRRERRWAAPFIIFSAGLFILGGLFAYFVAFRFGLTFLLGIGRGNYITPMVSVTEYFDLFVNVTLGVAIVFELPVLVFFLTLLRIVTPGFLIRNSRYAILGIFLLAAVVTPTPDVFNLMMFAVPMVLLFYVGIFASYLLVLNRENRRFPWVKVLSIVAAMLLLGAGAVYLAITKYGYQLVLHWPFLAR